MDNNTNEYLIIPNNSKPKSLKGNNKIRDNIIYLSKSINPNMINKFDLILSPLSLIYKNNNKNVFSIKKTKENSKIISTIKLIKNNNINNSLLPNISTQKSDSNKNIFLKSAKSIKNFSNIKFKNNFSSNKTSVNSKYLSPVEEKCKIRKIPTTFLFNKSFNNSDLNTQNKINNEHIFENIDIKIRKNKKIKKEYISTDNNFYNITKKKMLYSPKIQINQNNKLDNNEKILVDDFLTTKNGIYNLSDFNLKLLSKNIKNINKNYKKNKNYIKNKINNHNFFSEIKKENDLMKQKIKNNYSAFKELKKNYYLEKPNENTYEGFSKIFYNFNKDRSKKEKICTNRLITLDWAGDNSLHNIDYKENKEKRNKTKLNNIFFNSKGEQIYNYDLQNKNFSSFEQSTLCYRANSKVEKNFPDMLGFNLPKIFHDKKRYTIKLLYDVFIEFKTLLKFCIIYNKDINIQNKGIDFKTFFNCNTKINQQGEGLSKKIFKTLNNKCEKKYLPWGNYLDGMMRMKDPDMNHKMDLFFEILDENGDGSLDYKEVYNLSLVSLQRTLSQNPLDILKISEKEKQNQKEVIKILAEFFSKMIFSLVNIDINEEIPIDILRKKMQEGGEAAEYLEMFLCADNFA